MLWDERRGQKRGRKLSRVFYPAWSATDEGLLVAGDGGLDALQIGIGGVGAVFNLLQFGLVDAADAREELRDVALPLLRGAHALGGVEEGELLFQIIDEMCIRDRKGALRAA